MDSQRPFKTTYFLHTFNFEKNEQNSKMMKIFIDLIKIILELQIPEEPGLPEVN